MKLISKDTYLEELTDVQGTPDIKVITGVWQSGKSKLMEAFAAKLKAENPDVNIIHINLMLPENEEFLEYHALYDHVNSLVPIVNKIIDAPQKPLVLIVNDM